MNWLESSVFTCDLHTRNIYEGNQLLCGAPRWSAPVNVMVTLQFNDICVKVRFQMC